MDFIFKWQKDEPLWNVPWTGHTIFQVSLPFFLYEIGSLKDPHPVYLSCYGLLT